MQRLIFTANGSALRLSNANGGTALTILLRSDEILSCVPDGGAELCCLSGEVWVTRESDPRDHVLRTRDEYTLERGKRHVICALTEALVSVRNSEKGAS